MNTNNGWLDIASAPKDESHIWAFNGEQGRMQWSEGDGWALWVWCDPLLSDVDPAPDQPTHWMPLPAAPGSPAEQPAYTVTVDPDPRGVSVGVYLGSSCVYHGAHEVPAGAVADEGAVKRLRDAIEGECGGNWISEKQAAAVLAHLGHAAPAAGDALDAARYRWICDKFGVTKLPCAIERIIEGKYVADGKESIDAAIDAAIAASQQGGE